MPTILFLGATGYIGSAVFNAFINAHPAFDYIALVRTPSHSSHIRAVNTIVGTLEDRKLLTELAKKADIIVNVARADDLGMVEALIEGMKQSREEGKLPALIHTCSGDAFEGREFWDDMDEESVSTLLNKPVEHAILSADHQGILQAHFVVPTVVYGLNPYEKPSPFYLQIIRDLLSLPRPPNTPSAFSSLTSTALKEFPNLPVGMIHIDDLASLYLLLIDKILRVHRGSTPSSEDDASSRVYIVSVHERSRSQLYHDVHRALVKRGLEDACHTPPTSSDSSSEHPENHFISRRALIELGWEPAKPAWEHDMDWDINRALEVLKVTPSAPSIMNT